MKFEKNSSHVYSDLELHFDWYLFELKKAGLVLDYFRPLPIEIVPATSYDVVGPRSFTTGHLFQELTYEPDFIVYWNRDHKDLDAFVKTLPTVRKEQKQAPFFAADTKEGLVSVIEIKPGFNKITRKNYSQANSHISFPIKQKVMYHFLGIYVQKIVPYHNAKGKSKRTHLFPNTFTPQRFLMSDKNVRKRTIHFKTQTLSKYIDDYNKS